MMNQTPCFRILILNGLFLCLILSSCATYKNISYFKNVPDSPVVYREGKDIATSSYPSLKILPDDILKITINTLDPDLNGAANINTANNAAALPMSSSGITATGDKYPDGYIVNNEGKIDIPVIGQVMVGNLTIDEVRNKILAKASQFYKNPSVNVRLVNFRVTVLGEVARPGTYIVNGERISVLDAIGLSGDLTIYGKRENVMLIRQEGDAQKKIVRMNLNDVNMMTSPYFYMKQGDVIYVEPGKGKAAATDMAATRTYAIAGSALAVLITLVSRIKF